MLSPRSLFRWLLVLKDLAASILTLLFARLLPTIDVPLTDLSDSTAIVTGANSGVGKSICLELAKRNATVYLACRNVSKGQEVATEIIDACGEASSKRVHVVELDTSSLASVRAFAKSWSSKQLNLLIHNAGIAAVPSGGSENTPEGLGTIYATNFAGAFLLTSLLEPSMTGDSRVVFTSSVGQYAADYNRVLRLPGQLPSQEKQQSSQRQTPVFTRTLNSCKSFLCVYYSVVSILNPGTGSRTLSLLDIATPVSLKKRLASHGGWTFLCGR